MNSQRHPTTTTLTHLRWGARRTARMLSRFSLRGLSKAYCRAVVRRSLVSAPVGGHDWFWGMDPAP